MARLWPIRCVWSFWGHLLERLKENANVFQASGPENSKRIAPARPSAPLRHRWRAAAPRGLCTDEGALSFVTGMCCIYRDSLYKREWGGRMKEGPRLSRPAPVLRPSCASSSRAASLARGEAIIKC